MNLNSFEYLNHNFKFKNKKKYVLTLEEMLRQK